MFVKTSSFFLPEDATSQITKRTIIIIKVITAIKNNNLVSIKGLEKSRFSFSTKPDNNKGS